MAKLNLNFHQMAGCEPTKQEICQLEGIALSVDAMIKVMAAYCTDINDKEKANEALGFCTSICYALELLMEPIVDYMVNYARNPAGPEGEDPQEA